MRFKATDVDTRKVISAMIIKERDQIVVQRRLIGKRPF
jgi:hypothetical protein